MLGYVVRRSAQSLLLVWLVTVVVFALLHLTPGDPASVMLGENATPEQVQALQRSLGLDQPLVLQYARFLGRALHGDLGTSIRAQRPALEVVLERLPATLLLTAGAFSFAVLIGMPIGVISAVKRLSLWDDEMLDDLKYYDGSIQEIERVPGDLGSGTAEHGHRNDRDLGGERRTGGAGHRTRVPQLMFVLPRCRYAVPAGPHAADPRCRQS